MLHARRRRGPRCQRAGEELILHPARRVRGKDAPLSRRPVSSYFERGSGRPSSGGVRCQRGIGRRVARAGVARDASRACSCLVFLRRRIQSKAGLCRCGRARTGNYRCPVWSCQIELTIDSASDYAGLALTQEGRLLHERLWYCPRRHSSELLPAIDDLLRCNGASLQQIALIVACIGPGGYTGLRVGLTVAKALAYGLEARAVGVPRLLADAWDWLSDGPVCAVHRAGRSDVAFAGYARSGGEVVELAAPSIVPLEALESNVPPGAIVVGEVPSETAHILVSRGHSVVTGLAGQRRPLAVALIGLDSLARGAESSPANLLPFYLRPAVRPPN
jgi:tRNA threonylcarbamoyladenosine biosynthesis protein TsaB